MKLNSTREHKIINALGTTLSYKGSKHINGNRSNEIFSVIPTQFPTHWTLTLTGSHLQPLKKAFWVSLLEKKNIIRTFRWVLKDSTVGKIPSKSSKTYRIERCRPKVKYFPISPPPHIPDLSYLRRQNLSTAAQAGQELWILQLQSLQCWD